MDFVSTIKELRKLYHDTIKQYYNDKHILFKMLYHRTMYDHIYEIDLSFRTCMNFGFKDSRINYLLSNKPKKAVEQLRTRGLCCLYVVSAINYLIQNTPLVYDYDSEVLNKFKHIRKTLCDMAERDINLSNQMAKQNNLEPLSEDKLKIDEFRK